MEETEFRWPSLSTIHTRTHAVAADPLAERRHAALIPAAIICFTDPPLEGRRSLVSVDPLLDLWSLSSTNQCPHPQTLPILLSKPADLWSWPHPPLSSALVHSVVARGGARRLWIRPLFFFITIAVLTAVFAHKFWIHPQNLVATVVSPAVSSFRFFSSSADLVRGFARTLASISLIVALRTGRRFSGTSLVAVLLIFGSLPVISIHGSYLFDCLCCLLMPAENKERFLKTEGFELMIIITKQKKSAYGSAIRALDFAMTKYPPACKRFVDVLELKTVFAAFMGVQVREADSRRFRPSFYLVLLAPIKGG